MSLAMQLAMLAYCAGGSFAHASDETSQASSACEYRRVYVVRDGPGKRTDAHLERLRVEILKRAAGLLPKFGFRISSEPSDAYWRLFADGWLDSQGQPLVHLGMRGELKLGRHVFVVAMADKTFPYRGGLGGSYNFATASIEDPRALDAQVEQGMRWITGLDAAQLLALCAFRSELLDEGWTALEELRSELIEEMEQIRRARALATQQKKSLELQVEEGGRGEYVE